MATPKVREVHPGIFLLHLPLPMRPSIVNVFLIDGGDRWILIDTGMRSEESRAAFEAALAEIGCPPERIETIVCTHHHPDHCGASDELQQRTGARLLMHAAEHDATRHFAVGERPAFVSEYFAACGLPLHLFGHIPSPGEFWGSLYRPGAPDGYIADGDVLDCGTRRVRIVETPGHTRGHCVLHLAEERLLIVGDHLLPRITPHIGFFAGGAENPLADFIASQAKVADLDVDLILPAHGGVFPEHRHRARQIVQHHHARLQEILDILYLRPHSPYDVARRVFDFDVESSLTRQFPATFETMAHLEYLRHDGRVERREDGPVWMYRTGPHGSGPGLQFAGGD